MTPTREERGKQETAEADKKVHKPGKPAGGAHVGFTPFEPSPKLAAIIRFGQAAAQRRGVERLKKVKRNDLHKPEDKREILANDKLRKVFGGKRHVSMFEMNKHLSAHPK